MAGWKKMQLGMEVNLGPGHTVLNADPAPSERGTAAPPLFGPCLLWPRSPISATAELLLDKQVERQTKNSYTNMPSLLFTPLLKAK